MIHFVFILFGLGILVAIGVTILYMITSFYSNVNNTNTPMFLIISFVIGVLIMIWLIIFAFIFESLCISFGAIQDLVASVLA
jgi:hypothetical protein